MFLKKRNRDIILYIIDLIAHDLDKWFVRYDEIGDELMPYQISYQHDNTEIIVTKMTGVWQYKIDLRGEDKMIFYNIKPTFFCWFGIEKRLKRTIMYYFKKKREKTKLEEYFSDHINPRLKQINQRKST